MRSRFDKLFLLDINHINLFSNGTVSEQWTRNYRIKKKK